MIDKNQLASLLLRAHQPNFQDYEADPVRSYDRDKDQVICELSKYYQKAHSQGRPLERGKESIIKTPYLVEAFSQGKTKQKKSIVSIIPANHAKQQQEDRFKTISLNEYFEDKSNHPLYNQYMRTINKQQTNAPSSEGSTSVYVQTLEGPSIIEGFLKSPNMIDRLNASGQLLPARLQEPKTCQKENKSFNESTLALSKVTKLARNAGYSPNRSLRVTEKADKSRSKSTEKDHSLKKSRKSPSRLSLSKVSEIQFKLVPSGSIRHNVRSVQYNSTPKNTADNRLEYSKTNVNERQGALPLDIKPFSTPKGQPRESSIIPISKGKPGQVAQAQGQLKSKQRRDNRTKAPDQIVRIKLDLSSERQPSESKVQDYDYDQEDHIFDAKANGLNRQLPSKTSERSKISWNNVKDLWHIKDADKFRSQVKNQSEIYKEKHSKELSKSPIKDNKELVAKNDSLHHLTKKVQQPKIQSSEIQEEAEEEAEDHNGFHFLDFLKNKISSLTKTQPKKQKIQPIPSASKADQQQKRKNGPERVQKTIGQPQQPAEYQEEQSIRGQLSQNQSASSFIKEKKTIEQKGFRNVDLKNIVGQSVKRVSVNLKKVAEQQKAKDKSKMLRNQSKQSFPSEPIGQPLKEKRQSISQNGIKDQSIKDESSSLSQASISKNFSISKIMESQKQQKQPVPPQPSKVDITRKQISEPEKDKTKKQVMDELSAFEKPVNLSVDFFGPSNVSSKENGSDFSKPSTVQKIDSNSAQKSDFLHHFNFQDQKEDSIAQNLFEKTHSEKKYAPKAEISLDKGIRSQKEQSKGEPSELQLSYDTSIIKRPQKVQISLSSLKQITLSDDALSFSKLQSASDYEKQGAQQPVQPIVIASDKLEREAKQEQVKNKIEKPIELKKEQPKLGKVKRIEIKLEESSSDEEIIEDSDTNEQCQIDLDEIRDYDSDEDTRATPAQPPISSNQRRKVVLAPVAEEELEESEFNKFSHNKPGELLRKNYSKSSQKDLSMQQLQKQFLKDFLLNKVESEVQQYSAPQHFKKMSSMKQGKEKIKIKIKPTESKFTNLQGSKSQPHEQNSGSLFGDQGMKDEKSLLEGIKQDIEKLKNKIECSVILDKSKISQGKNLGKPSSKDTKRVEIDLSSHNASSFLKSLSKIQKEQESEVASEKKEDDKGNNKKLINFDQINEDNGRQLFESFREDLNSLKKKMQNDALQGY